jgi:hypothetical protein
VNLKRDIETLDCLRCHHAKSSPTKCLACHADALASAMSETFKGFDHGLHANSSHIKNACRICHLSGAQLEAPPQVSCSVCHHPPDVAIGLDCGICHTEAEIRNRIQNPNFDHALHVQAGYPCLNCHGPDALRTPEAGNACGRCHHLQQGGCRSCHSQKLYFEKNIRSAAGGLELSFVHAVHETDDNCGQCHPAGPDIRLASRALNCADCHHHPGTGLDCGTCHPGIEPIRAGRLPTGETGQPEAMYGIVSCLDCHQADPSKHHALTDGSRSCTRCHPEEYQYLLVDRRNALEKAFREMDGLDEKGRPPYNIRQGLHNFQLILSDLRRRAAQAGPR